MKQDRRRTWTDKELDFLTEECRRGELMVKEIAARMGRPENQVRHQMRERGLKIARRARFWTEQRNALLRQMWAEDISLREIARHIGTTHGGVERQAHELGLPRRGKPHVAAAGRCPTCRINAEHMAGCPIRGCAHYAAPVEQGERTLAGVVGVLA